MSRNIEDFGRFLQWLDPDIERASNSYLELHRALTRFFMQRGALHSEELADKTIDRVMQRFALQDKGLFEIVKPRQYIFAVAKHVLLELNRKEPRYYSLDDVPELKDIADRKEGDATPTSEDYLVALDAALQELPEKERTLILRYYGPEKQAKIDSRAELANKYGIGVNALRVRLYRIRAALAQRVQELLDTNKISSSIKENRNSQR